MRRVKNVDDYIANADNWQDEIRRLRDILKTTALHEEIKWGSPCYSYNGKNIVAIVGFESYFGLWFYQGALLEDSKQRLINAQEGKTRAQRQWRMTSANDIKPAIIKRYIEEAMALVDHGQEIKPDRTKPIDVPEELRNALRRSKGATAAFAKLRPGLQREYANYIGSARRATTRQTRISKILPMIAAGKGLNDQYR